VISGCDTHFKSELRQNGSTFKESCASRYQRGTLLKSGYLSVVGLSSVKIVADLHRHAAYHNKH